MSRRPRLLVLALAALLAFARPAGSTEPIDGTIRGTITDSSDGALPGVSVTATSPDGRGLATAGTDQPGTYEILTGSAPERHLACRMDGCAAAGAPLTVEAGSVSVLRRRLELAPLTETVVVVGRATDSPPAVQAPPRPVVIPLADHDRD